MKHINSSDYPIGSDTWKYARLLEEKRGHNFEYWNESHENLLNNGWNLHEFDDGDTYTNSELIAKDALMEHRDRKEFARIVCGMVKTIQRRKSFSVIYKIKS